MKSRLFTALLLIFSLFTITAQTGLVSGELNVSVLPQASGGGHFNLVGTFSDPKGSYFAADVTAQMSLWKGNNYYEITVSAANGNQLTLVVADTYTTGFMPTGIYSIGEETANLKLPGVSTTGDSNPALSTPPDYGSKFNYILKLIDQGIADAAGNGMFDAENQDSTWGVSRYYINRRVDGILNEKGQFVLQDSSGSQVGPVFDVTAGTGGNPAYVRLGDGVEMPFFQVEGQGQTGAITAGFGDSSYHFPIINPGARGLPEGVYVPVVDSVGNLVGTGWMELLSDIRTNKTLLGSGRLSDPLRNAWNSPISNPTGGVIDSNDYTFLFDQNGSSSFFPIITTGMNHGDLKTICIENNASMILADLQGRTIAGLSTYFFFGGPKCITIQLDVLKANWRIVNDSNNSIYTNNGINSDSLRTMTTHGSFAVQKGAGASDNRITLDVSDAFIPEIRFDGDFVVNAASISFGDLSRFKIKSSSQILLESSLGIDVSTNSFRSLYITSQEIYLQANSASNKFNISDANDQYTSLDVSNNADKKGIILVGYGESDVNDTGNLANYNPLVRTSLTPKGYVDDLHIRITKLTATEAAALTVENGLFIYLTTTDATFNTLGFWGYEQGVWVDK